MKKFFCSKAKGQESSSASSIAIITGVMGGMAALGTAFVFPHNLADRSTTGGSRWGGLAEGFFDRRASELVVDLDGGWAFSLGDDPAWAAPSYDDRAWDRIESGRSWERAGFEYVDGFAWYRRSFSLPSDRPEGALYLHLGRIDDADEVFLNGVKIGATGLMPPTPDTAWDTVRAYAVPPEALRFGDSHVLAVRVYDERIEGGLVSKDLGLYVSTLPEPLIDLRGWWEISRTDSLDSAMAASAADGFAPIIVPGEWGRQGMAHFDGYAWYRKEFNLAPRSQELVLLLGRIDDQDTVYLNGQRIGSTGEEALDDGDWEKDRAYVFDGSMLQDSGNILTVRVFDARQSGGIYRGPVGIMTVGDFTEYARLRKDLYSRSSVLWDWIWGRR